MCDKAPPSRAPGPGSLRPPSRVPSPKAGGRDSEEMAGAPGNKIGWPGKQSVGYGCRCSQERYTLGLRFVCAIEFFLERQSPEGKGGGGGSHAHPTPGPTEWASAPLSTTGRTTEGQTEGVRGTEGVPYQRIVEERVVLLLLGDDVGQHRPLQFGQDRVADPEGLVRVGGRRRGGGGGGGRGNAEGDGGGGWGAQKVACAPAAPAFTRPSSPSQFRSCATVHSLIGGRAGHSPRDHVRTGRNRLPRATRYVPQSSQTDLRTTQPCPSARLRRAPQHRVMSDVGGGGGVLGASGL